MSRVRDAAQQAKKAAFLSAFAELGTVTHAAIAAGIERTTHYRWVKEDDAYAKGFVEAEGKAIDSLEREARRRAIEGTEKPIYQGGQMVGTVREYSDTLLIFLMKGANPSRYRERIDLTVDVRRTAEQFATAHGLDVDEVMAEAERILAETT
jgi:hypothetical protein